MNDHQVTDAPVEQTRKWDANPLRKTHHCIISATFRQMRHRQRLTNVKTTHVLDPAAQAA
jgi:hypothetical protein